MTIGASSSNSTTSAPDQTSKVLIARDGAKRREEYISPDSEHIIYLETPAGRFVLLPASKLYADLASQNEAGVIDPVDESAVVSTDELLNEAHEAVTYQTLGTEVVGGRTMTKYRVTTAKVSSEANERRETLIWVDEALGMPVRSETTSGVEGSSAKTIMELKDVRLEVDQHLFEIPEDYKKVAASLFHQRIRRNNTANAKDQQRSDIP